MNRICVISPRFYPLFNFEKLIHHGHDPSPWHTCKGSSEVLDFPMTIISMLTNIKHQGFSKGLSRSSVWRILCLENSPCSDWFSGDWGRLGTPLSLAWRPWGGSFQSRGSRGPSPAAQPLWEHERFYCQRATRQSFSFSLSKIASEFQCGVWIRRCY